MSLRKALNRELEIALSEKGWSKRLLSLRSGVSQKHISQLMLGRSGTIEMYEALAEVLGIEFEVRHLPTRCRTHAAH